MEASMNTKRPFSTDSMMGLLSSRMSAAPSGMFVSNTMKGLENAVNARTGLANQERLMNAAKSKQQQQQMLHNYERSIGVEISEIIPDVDLSSPKNAPLLNNVAQYVLQHSELGESILRMADKVVVMCTVMHDIPGLDKKYLILAVNDVFMHLRINDSIDVLISRTMKRMQASENKKKKEAELSWLSDEWGVGDGNSRRYYEGGFHTKTKCRRNKMRKSRKSRNRR